MEVLGTCWMFWGEDGAQQPALCAPQTSSARGRGFALAVRWSSPTHGQAAGEFGYFLVLYLESALQGALGICAWTKTTSEQGLGASWDDVCLAWCRQ